MASGPDRLQQSGLATLSVQSISPDPGVTASKVLSETVMVNGGFVVVGEVDRASSIEVVISAYDSLGNLVAREDYGTYANTGAVTMGARAVSITTGGFAVVVTHQDASGSGSQDANVKFYDAAGGLLRGPTALPSGGDLSQLQAYGLAEGGITVNTNSGYAIYGNSLYSRSPGGVPTPYASANVGPDLYFDFAYKGGHLLHSTHSAYPKFEWYWNDGDSNPVASNSVAAIGNGKVAVLWTDTAGASYLAIADTVAHSLTTPLLIDQGPALDATPGSIGRDHVVALWDGSFVVQLPGKYETFDSTGTIGGGWQTIDTTLEGLNSNGQVVGLGFDSHGNVFERSYNIISQPTPVQSSGGSEVHTSDANYTAPDGVTTIYLTGSNQTVTGNDQGDTIWSDNTVNHITGGTGADTFHIGRAGDVVSGAGGADAFAFAETPWAGAEITDFSSDDTVDLSGLLARSGYAGSDPVADGYIKITDDGHGQAQVWSNLDKVQAGLGWYLVATLDHVAPSALHMQGGAVVMTGAAPTGQTYTSDNNGDHWTGTDGADTFNLGRGGDVVAGLGGADLFKFAETPWAGAEITDFSAEDTIDLSGLLARSGYTGSDAVADGYIKITDDGRGDGQVWSNLDKVQAGLGWYLVVTTDHVAGASLHMDGAFITG